MRCPELRLNRRMRGGRLRDGPFLVMRITRGRDRARGWRYPSRSRCDPVGSCSVNLAQPRFAASCCLAQLSASRGSEKSW
jgi:hypothetical protein